MHWTWPELDSEKEAKKREKIAEKMDLFWSAFAEKVPDFHALFTREKSWDLPTWMHDHLSPIAEGIMWEFGPAPKGKGHRLVLTPEDNYPLRPVVDALLARAPKLAGWQFFGSRLPETGKRLIQTIEARSRVKMPAVRATVSRGKYHTVDIEFEVDGLKKKVAEELLGLLVETTVGEQILARWIGSVTLGEKKRKKSIPLDEVHDAVQAEIAIIEKERPKKPCIDRVEKAEWSLFKNAPDDQLDYERQEDIMVAPTMHPDLWIATRSENFADERFSKHGEIFAYVKTDGREGLEGTAFGDREDIENAITAVIAKDRLGAVVGGGTGRFYSYIELALLEVPEAVERIRKVLRDGKIHKRSWILFHDPALTNEWVGIHPTTPAPP